MVVVKVRRGSVDATIECSSVGELYQNVARHFNIEHEESIRLLHRGRLLLRTSDIAEIPEGVTLTMGESYWEATSGVNEVQEEVQPILASVQARQMTQLISNAIASALNTDGTPEVVVMTFNTDGTGEVNASEPVEGVPIASTVPGPHPSVIHSSPQRPSTGVNNYPPRSASHPLFYRTQNPFVAGAYLHIHCQLDELDSVPEKLSRLQRRLNETSFHGSPRANAPEEHTHVSETSRSSLSMD